MCWDTLWVGTAASKQCVLQYSVLQFLEVFASRFLQIAVEWFRQGVSKGTCSPVVSCDSDCVLQVVLGTSHWNCYIMDAISNLDVRISTKHCVLSGTWGLLCGGKLARLRDGCWRRRFSVESCSDCARNVTDSSR